MLHCFNLQHQDITPPKKEWNWKSWNRRKKKRKSNNHFPENHFIIQSPSEIHKNSYLLIIFFIFSKWFHLIEKIACFMRKKKNREMEKSCCCKITFLSFPISMSGDFTLSHCLSNINKEKCRTKLWYGSSNIVFVFDEL